MNGNEKNILLVISTTRESPRTIEAAFMRAKEIQGTLVALCVIDTELSGSIAEKLADSGFVGDKPGEEVCAQILKEYRGRAERKLQEIAAAAKAQGVNVKTLLKQGDLVEEALKAIEEEKAARVVIGRKKVSKFSQFIFGSPIKKIEKNAPCPVEVIEE